MVEDYKILVEPLKEKQIIFFAVLKMDDLTDRWSLVFSAKDVEDIEKRRNLFSDVIKLANDNLGAEARANIARFGIFPEDEKMIQDLLKQKPNKIFRNERANGNFIHEGVVLIPDVGTPAETSTITAQDQVSTGGITGSPSQSPDEA